MRALVRRLLALQMVRFGAVGATVTVCFMALNAGFSRGLGWPSQVAFLAAYPPALGLHFMLNKLWTFGDRRTITRRHVSEYLFAVLVTFLIQWPAFTLLQSVAHLPGWLAAGAANVIQMGASFLLLRRRVFNSDRAPAAPAATGREAPGGEPIHRMSPAAQVATAAALAATAWVYIWTVRGTPDNLDFSRSKGDYYNLLVEGFRRGHLYMNAVPDPALLAALAAPSSAGSRYRYLMDASLYRGHYYLYFGPVPAVLLYWPYAALTGRELPEGMGGLVFSLIGTAWAAWIWLDLRRRWFPRAGAIWTGLALLTLGLGTAIPATLRHPLFYETAAAAGYAFGMMELWTILRARQSRRPARWLCAAGVAAGLAIGARANLGVAAILLLGAGAGAVARSGPAGQRRRRWVTALAWSALGAGAIGGGLVAYNVARFGDPLEFGHSYQLGINPQRMFRASNLAHNFRLYYLSPPSLNAYFPFVAPQAETAKPRDYIGREQADGEWIWSPLIVAAGLALAWSRWGKPRRVPRDAVWELGLPALWFGVNLVVTGAAGARANRYLLDFHPALAIVVLAALGLVGSGRSFWARVGAWLAGLGCVAVILFNLFASFEVHGFFAGNDPAGYDRVARLADRMAWPLLRFGPPVGDREVALRWPAVVPIGTREPMVGAGAPTFDDVLWVEYGAADRARFVYDFDERGSAFGPWFQIRAGMPVTLRVSGALLLPRPGHPWYGARPIAEQIALKQTLRVYVDGEERFARAVPSHDSSPRLQRWGIWRLVDGRVHQFSGNLGLLQPLPVNAGPADEASAGDRGDVAMRLLLPVDRMGSTEPLVQFGGGQRFDLVAVRYIRPGTIQLIHDQAGGGADASPEFAADYARWHEVVVETPAATDGLDWREGGPLQRGKILKTLRITWDGQVRFESKHPPLLTPSEQVIVGANLGGSSISLPLFRGILEAGDRRGPLGALHEGQLTFNPHGSAPWLARHGVIARFTSHGGDTANLIWRRAADGEWQFGWNESGVTTWSLPAPGEIGTGWPIAIAIPGPAVDAKPVAVTMGGVRLTALSDLFGDPPIRAEAVRVAHWSGSARPPETTADATQPTGPAHSLPGIVRLSFRLPTHRLIAGSPLLSAGKSGAADSVYLRQRTDGRFVLGLDHWIFPATESEPFELSDDDVHVVLIELGSLAAAGEIPASRVRLTIDGRTVLDCRHPLYPAQPSEVAFGANPLGMSTSHATFDGEILAVRTHLHARP